MCRRRQRVLPLLGAALLCVLCAQLMVLNSFNSDGEVAIEELTEVSALLTFVTQGHRCGCGLRSQILMLHFCSQNSDSSRAAVSSSETSSVGSGAGEARFKSYFCSAEESKSQSLYEVGHALALA